MRAGLNALANAAIGNLPVAVCRLLDRRLVWSAALRTPYPTLILLRRTWHGVDRPSPRSARDVYSGRLGDGRSIPSTAVRPLGVQVVAGSNPVAPTI